MRRWFLLLAVVGAFGLLGCSNDSPLGPLPGSHRGHTAKARERPPYAPEAEVGRAYTYILSTHCGVRFALIDGRMWDADRVIERRPGGDARMGFNYTKGEMTLESEKRAVFRSPGTEASFHPRAPGTQPYLCA